MDAQIYGNQTTTQYDTRLDATFFIFNCAVLTVTLVLGLPGNLWVCWVVFRTKSLQTCNNALLVSLAANDLLNCSVCSPLLLSSFLCNREDNQFSVPVCILQQFTYALCSCVQLLTLVSISVERFQAIAFPFQSERRRARARLWILFIWTCGFILAVISLTLPKQNLFYVLCRRHTGSDGENLRYWDPFGPYVLVPVWGLSMTVIIIYYMRIFKVVRQHRKKVFHQGVQLPPVASENVWSLMGAPASTPSTAGPGPFRSLLTVGSSSPLPPRRAMLLVNKVPASTAGSTAGGASGGPLEIVGAVCLLTPEVRERGKKQMEGRVAQRFGYIIIAFTLLWVPMVVILLMSVISWQDTAKARLLMELETSAMALTCVQAAVDPLIYTLVTRQFRSELRKILSSIPGWPLKPRA